MNDNGPSGPIIGVGDNRSYDDNGYSTSYYSGVYVPGVFGGRCGVVSTPWYGPYRPPCPVPTPYRYGSTVRGSYTSGKWSLNFRFGF